MLCELRACWSNEKVENEAVALLLSRNVPHDLSRNLTLQAKGRTDDCLPARVTNADVQIPSRGQTRAKPTPQPRNMRICLPAIPSIFSSRRPGHSLPFLDSILFSPNIPVITCWQASGHHDIAIVKLKNNLEQSRASTSQAQYEAHSRQNEWGLEHKSVPHILLYLAFPLTLSQSNPMRSVSHRQPRAPRSRR